MTMMWIKAASIRALKTFAQAAVAMLTIGQSWFDVNWASVFSVAATAAIISVLTSLAGLPEVKEEKNGNDNRA